jgi:DNA-binding CsgD family transcriptional regulator
MGDRPLSAADMRAAPVAASTAFRFRKGYESDLPHCLTLLPAALRPHAPRNEQLLKLWSELLSGEARVLAIIEDLERPYPASIEAFGMSVFVTDKFAEEFCAAPEPFLPALVYERMLAGESIVLSAQELLRANTITGINIVVLHFGMRNDDLTAATTAQALAVGSAAFFFFHGGYRINCVINETYGAQAARYMEAGGFRLMRDFQNEAPAVFADISPAHYPYLFMLRRDWIEPGAVNPLSMLLSSNSMPRIFFSNAERRVLERALLNESDAQICAGLGVSVDAIKKSWRSIYGRVGRHAPFVIPASDLGPPGSRGQEKRRHLLEYLRTHLEELRPSSPPTHAAAFRKK